MVDSDLLLAVNQASKSMNCSINRTAWILYHFLRTASKNHGLIQKAIIDGLAEELYELYDG